MCFVDMEKAFDRVPRKVIKKQVLGHEEEGSIKSNSLGSYEPV